MNTHIKLLVIEDKPADFKLIVRHLETHGLPADCHCVSTTEEMEAALAQDGWDAVLSDYNVPKMDFQNTLGLLQSQHPDLPVILVSGTIGEERAVELLKLGSWDFVLKDNMTRLVPAIERSLRDVVDRRARSQSEAAMIASETRYRRLFESAKDGILILDAETGMVMDANPYLIEMLGYSKEVFIGKKVWELGFFKDLVANETHFIELQAKEYIRYEDMALETSDGRRIEVEFVSNVYLMNRDKVIQCNIRDISERVRAAAALQQQAEDLRVRNDTLTRFNAVAVGRELRMIELKREVNELCGKLGEPPRHKIVCVVSEPPASLATREGPS